MILLRTKKRIVVWAVLLSWLAAPIAFAAIGTAVTPEIVTSPGLARSYVIPVSSMKNWVTVCSDPLTADATPSINPLLVTRSAQHRLQMVAGGTTVPFRLKYATAGTVSTQCVVRAFGIDANGKPERLADIAGTMEWTLTTDATNDARDGTYSYTLTKEVDANGNKEVMILVQTAFAGTGQTAAALEAKSK